MSAYEFCREVLKDIRVTLSNPNQYNVIRVSGLVRQLLFDQNQLLLLAQKQSERPFRFYMNRPGFDYDPAIASSCYVFHMFGCLEPDDDCVEVPPEKYGNLNVLMSNNQLFSIKDLIKYVANKRGGIHYDPENLNEDQQIIDRVSKAMQLGGLETVISQVGYIGQNMVSSAVRSGYIGV